MNLLKPGNLVTAVRAALTAGIAVALLQPHTDPIVWTVVAAAVLVTALDGVDGWIARRTGTVSAFGARFDMEVDSALILVLSILAWQYEKAGAWVILSGLLRYLFVAAGWQWTWLQQPLFPSRRRQTICVVQVVGLIATVSPVVTPPTSIAIAATALAVLFVSFAIDTIWLMGRPRSAPTADLGRASSAPAPDIVGPGQRWGTLAVAVALLNVSLAFDNLWPTPAITWLGCLSIEFAVCILLLIVVRQFVAPPSRAAIGWLSAIWLVLVLGRYADVTAPALYGRDINLYWDLRFIPDVAAMVIRAAPAWLILLACVVAALVVLLLYGILRAAIARLARAMEQPHERRALAVLALAMGVLFAVRPTPPLQDDPHVLTFSAPVTAVYARQARLVFQAVTGSRAIAPSPSMASDLALVDGADVFLIFIESYGAVSWDRPAFAASLADSRRQFDGAIHATGRDVVSAFVESPTFGGSSWLAHISLMSGVEVRDPETNALLMTKPRDTVVTAFKRRGFRTVALMPGLKQQWPEGVFYKFDDIYNADRLKYRGPGFGWFTIPDQFSIASLDAAEVARPARAPLFVFYPTISTHFPFSPTPPYQPDWPRVLTADPFTEAEVDDAYSTQPDWLDFGPGYVAALTYDFAAIGGYLTRRPEKDVVMILLGDHQPPAAVSREGAPWDVPVHVIASRPAVLDALVARGFHRGLSPERPTLSKMHALLPTLLSAFGSK
ncbi:MAG: CDP-alcohol phosphatidyltransferase family protein [Acidobacteria bacterium]|nr:CDP-alcohol phosphatidyltransferase family protein [Acidobacteriota bacterium]